MCPATAAGPIDTYSILPPARNMQVPYRVNIRKFPISCPKKQKNSGSADRKSPPRQSPVDFHCHTDGTVVYYSR